MVTTRLQAFFWIFFLAIAIPNCLCAQKREITKVLVAEIPFFTPEKMLPVLNHLFAEHPGIIITGYCNDRKWVFLTVSAERFPDRENVESLFKNSGIQVYLKDPVPVQDVVNACGKNYVVVPN